MDRKVTFGESVDQVFNDMFNQVLKNKEVKNEDKVKD